MPSLSQSLEKKVSTNKRSVEILCVDDDRNLLEIVKMRLESAGYKVYTALLEEDAIDLLHDRLDIGLAILDLQLGNSDGISLMEEIHSFKPGLPVIILTAHGSIESAVEAMKRGAFNYLTKPFDPRELLLQIEKGIEKLDLDSLLAQLSGRLFLSYAREDKNHVENLYRKLKQAGFFPWMDVMDIVPGEVWESSVMRAIKDSDFFLACISQSSVTKRGMIQKEIRTALSTCDTLLDGDIYLIPIRLEECYIPERLSGFQWVDLYAIDGWKRLVTSIREGLKRRAVAASQAREAGGS